MLHFLTSLFVVTSHHMMFPLKEEYLKNEIVHTYIKRADEKIKYFFTFNASLPISAFIFE